MASDTEWAREEAAQIAVDYFDPATIGFSSLAKKIGAALLAAEQRGREAEREACLKICADEAVSMRGQGSPRGVISACNIDSAIRSRALVPPTPKGGEQ